ncbi:MAG: DUF4852 domain-containing protein [Alphaproteobacteria bacterium]|nr:DUF4852 domain-containing protein [Alphaproteobacteria bacterium]
MNVEIYGGRFFMFNGLKVLFFGVLVCLLPAASVCAQASPPKNVRYEIPTMSTLSMLYWAIGKLDLQDNTDVDNYMFINECGLYRDFYHNEFEWGSVRNAGRKYLMENKKNFPTRFEYVQRIRLGEYNVDKEYFDIVEQDKILGGRSFEILARDVEEYICDEPVSDLKGYPKGLYVELNRPVNLDKVYVPRALAEEYIERKLEVFKKLPVSRQTRKIALEIRDAYLVMKVRILAYDQEVDLTSGLALKLAKVLSTLEGYEIYGDKERKNLLFVENHDNVRVRSVGETDLREKYEERLARHAAELKDKETARKAKLESVENL